MPLRCRSGRGLRPLRAVPDPQDPESYEGGDKRLQDALVNQLKFEIGKKQVCMLRAGRRTGRRVRLGELSISLKVYLGSLGVKRAL